MLDKLDAENQAHLMVIYKATVLARNLGLNDAASKRPSLLNLFRARSNSNSALIADLMDAIHNTPEQIIRSFCSTEEYVRTYYEAFDKKHPKNYISLVNVFNENVQSNAI